jgi:hypothetical protein
VRRPTTEEWVTIGMFTVVAVAYLAVLVWVV